MTMAPKLLRACVYFCLYHFSLCANIEIRPIRSDQVAQAIEVFFDVVYELQLVQCTSRQEVIDFFNRTHQSKDYDDVDVHYFNNRGTFLVVTENQKVIGTGAIRFLDDESCELKRFYLAKEYRRNGLGTLLLKQLISYALDLKYKKMRLEVYFPAIQKAAVAFYKKCGFYEIPPYRESRAQLRMELAL